MLPWSFFLKICEWIVENNVYFSLILFQCSYSSLSFLKVLWPEFSVWDFYGAILSFQWNYKAFKVKETSVIHHILFSSSQAHSRNTSLGVPVFFFGLFVSQQTGCEIAPNTGANATKFSTLATKSWKLVAKLATRTFHHNLTKRYSELKRFAKINPRQTSSLSLFPKRNTCISSDN